MKNLTFTEIETFITVAKSQSFTQAAFDLEKSKATVSQIIKQLETTLQLRLFHRTTRSITLTNEGELFLQQCLRVQYELDTASELVTCLHQKPTGTLKISCNPTLSDTYLLPKLLTYRKKFPDVDIEIISEERMPDIKKEQIDLVFGVNWPPPEDIVARKISTARYVLCASPHYLKKYGTPQSLEDLEQHIYIPHKGRDRNTPIVSLKKASKKLILNTPLCANNILFIKSCVMKGLGIAQFYDYIVENEIKTGKLKEVLHAVLKGQEALYIYYQIDRYVQPKVRELVKLLLG